MEPQSQVPLSTPNPVQAQPLASVQQGKVEAPLILRVVTLLGLIGAFIGFFASFGGLFFTFRIFGLSFISLLVVLALLKSVFVIVALFGLRQMKKWAYYIFVVATLLAVLMLIPSHANEAIVETILEVAFLAYLYSIKNMFV